MATLFNDTDLFTSGELRIQQFHIPDAELTLWEHFIQRAEADQYYHTLLAETPWKQEEITVYNKTYLTPRMTIWYGKQRDAHKSIRPFTPTLQLIKDKVEAITNISFTSLLVNLYRDGKDGVGWHRDNEREHGPKPIVASVSFGETRAFDIRHKFRDDLQKIRIPLHHGSLLLMAGTMQHFWEHQVSKTAKKIKPRINLTFRIVHHKDLSLI
ncbi:MAG: alpha-ketoglutarate-dependent dioxygenase AlkB [Chitinophagaceae bacterium]